MNGEFNLKLILKIQGSLLIVESIFLLSALFVSLYFRETVWIDFLYSAGIGLGLGLIGFFAGWKALPNIGKREGSVIVTLTWLLFSFVGMLPFLFSGSIQSVPDAFFETMSGFTTTGASILNNIEELPYSILYWRSMTHWIGGIGIIVISMALLPIFGFSGMQLFSAEATGPTKDKIHPKISETAKRLLAIYVVLTVAEIILLRIAGMNWFDAICHSFGTIATGGFSTKQASIGHYNSPFIEYVIIFFMIFSGINFTLYYFFAKLKLYKVLMNEELRTFLLLILAFTVIITLSQFDFNKEFSWITLERFIRNGLFATTATITTTGFVTVDYNLWPPFTWYLIIILMLIGSSAGSTAGGMKVIRVLLVFKYSYLEFKRIIHPNAIFPVRYNGHVLPEQIIARVLAFILLYFIIIFIGATFLSITGLGYLESFSGMITCLSDVGPGLGSIGPANNYSHLPDVSKWFLTFVMLVGRLEIFTVLLLFTPIFWKR
ncbi:MAG: TrkH family potassium uptake protein [Paludibacter sp.]|nr:TrkH family potassium uptake protein [Paludibacter sp.]